MTGTACRLWPCGMRRFAVLLVAAVLLGGATLSAHAQGADTTWMANPYAAGTYEHYWIGSCYAAIQRDSAWVTRARRDTMPYSMSGDTMTTSAVRVGETCLAAVGPERVPARDLVVLGQVYLAIRQDTLAESAMERRIAAAEEMAVGERAAVMGSVVAAYLSAKPARVARAASLMTRLDALPGSEAALQRLLSYYAFAQYYNRAGDDVATEEALSRVVELAAQLRERDRTEFAGTIAEAYVTLAHIAGRRTGAPEESVAIMQRALQALKGVEYMLPLLIQREALMSFYGRKAPQVTAHHWFSQEPGDTIHPKPGRPSLIVFNASRNMIPALRRISLHEPDSVDVTLVLATSGVFRFMRPPNVDAEVEELRKFYVDDLKVAGTLAITETGFIRLPDNRRVPTPNPNDRVFGTRLGMSILLTDSQGIIRRMYSQWEPWVENRIIEALQRIR